LAHVLQPIQLVITDEGLNGLDLHLINETGESVAAQLELVCLRDGAVKVASATCAVDLAPRSKQRLAAAECLGQFFDLTHAYRFGPPAHDVTIATLRDVASGRILSRGFHLPQRRATERYDTGLSATLEATGKGWQLVVQATRFSRFVNIADAHYRAADNWFHLPPGEPRTVALLPLLSDNSDATPAAPSGEVRAINSNTPVFYG
jgi:beta-mannosidase